MAFERFESVFTLMCVIVGILSCISKYIKNPKRTYLYLAIYFVAHFFSDYNWSVYLLVMNSYPVGSSIMANLGWNIAYFFLLLTVIKFRKEQAERRGQTKAFYFHPLMLWPLATNIPLFILYIHFGGIINNLWQVGTTTLVMIISTGELLYYRKNKKNGTHFPYLAVLILLYEVLSYGMWTASCFDWDTDFLDPYFYCEILASTVTVFFAWALNKNYDEDIFIKEEKDISEIRFMTALETISTLGILVLCLAGYFVALRIKNKIPVISGNVESLKISVIVFFISAILVFLVLFLIYIFRRILEKRKASIASYNRSKFNLIFMIFFTLSMMLLTVIMSTRKFYTESVSDVLEKSENELLVAAEHIENYLKNSEAALQIIPDKSLSQFYDEQLLEQAKKEIKGMELEDKAIGMLIDNDGTIIAHSDEKLEGRKLSELYDDELFEKISKAGDGQFIETLNDVEYTVYVESISNNWFDVVIVNNDIVFEKFYSLLLRKIMVSIIIGCLIIFFYYLGFKNEQIYGRKVEKLNLQVVRALAAAIDAKDKYTKGHSSRVAYYSKMIASRAGLSEAEQDDIYMMGLLHDVGKIGVPDDVINKPARLTDEEFELIKKHPVIGNDILRTIKDRADLCVGARWHHERYDGRGYPDGLAGEQIPVAARIIAVADAYDAMTSTRSYREVILQEKVRKEIECGAGSQFDPQFAMVMIEMIDEDVNYTMHE